MLVVRAAIPRTLTVSLHQVYSVEVRCCLTIHPPHSTQLGNRYPWSTRPQPNALPAGAYRVARQSRPLCGLLDKERMRFDVIEPLIIRPSHILHVYIFIVPSRRPSRSGLTEHILIRTFYLLA